MDAQYRLTYDDAAAPSHYGWKQASQLDRIERQLKAAESGDTRKAEGPVAISPEEVRRILAALDEQGRWVSVYDGEGLVGQPKFSPGTSFLSSAVFSRNVETLSGFLAATAK